MPIEVLDRPGNKRLIAAEPLRLGEKATIWFSNATGSHQAEVCYRGGRSNGYPALSPGFCAEWLPELERIERERYELLRNDFGYLNLELYPIEGYYSTRLTALEDIAAIASTVPIFPSIKIGRELIAVMPRPFTTTRYILGTVEAWAIPRTF